MRKTRLLTFENSTPPFHETRPSHEDRSSCYRSVLSAGAGKGSMLVRDAGLNPHRMAFSRPVGPHTSLSSRESRSSHAKPCHSRESRHSHAKPRHSREGGNPRFMFCRKAVRVVLSAGAGKGSKLVRDASLGPSPHGLFPPRLPCHPLHAWLRTCQGVTNVFAERARVFFTAVLMGKRAGQWGLVALLFVSTAGAFESEDGPAKPTIPDNCKVKAESPSSTGTGTVTVLLGKWDPELKKEGQECEKAYEHYQKQMEEYIEWESDWEDRKDAKERAEKEEDRQEKCKEAHEKYLSDTKDAKEEQNKHTETFQNLQDQITKEEAGIRQAETDSAENLKKLTRESKRTIHRLRDQLDQELKRMDGQVTQMENNLSQMEGQLDEIQIERMKILTQKQELAHQIYKMCYEEAEKKLFDHKKKLSNRTRHQSMSQLVLASRQRIKKTYQRRFDHYLNYCLTKSPLQNTKQTKEKEFQIQLTALQNKENRLRQAIENFKKQIAKIKTTDKLQVMNRFKRDMQEQVNNFEADFNSYAGKFASTHEERMKNIGNLKQKQAQALHQRSEAVPQDTKNALLANQCAQAEQAFNLFSAGRSGSTSSLPYRGMSSGYGAGQ